MPENAYRQILPTAARTASVSTPTAPQAGSPVTDANYFNNFDCSGILVILDVTAASGTGGLVVKIEAYDSASGKFVQLNQSPTAVTAIGTTTYVLYPSGGAANAFTQVTNGAGLPLYWRVTVSHGDGTSYTYSVGAFLLK